MRGELGRRGEGIVCLASKLSRLGSSRRHPKRWVGRREVGGGWFVGRDFKTVGLPC